MTSKFNVVGWFEIPVEDMERAMKFYTTVFGYELSRNKMGEYDMAWFPMNDDVPGANGSLIKGGETAPSMVGSLVYFNSPSEDLANELAKVESAGGKVLQEKMSINEFGFIAIAQDTEGNKIGFWSQN